MDTGDGHDHGLQLNENDLQRMHPLHSHSHQEKTVARLLDNGLTPRELDLIRIIAGTHPRKSTSDPENEIQLLHESLMDRGKRVDAAILTRRLRNYLVWKGVQAGPRFGDSSTIEEKASVYLTKYHRRGLSKQEYSDIVRLAVAEATPWIDLGAGPRRVEAELKRSLERHKRRAKRIQKREAKVHKVGQEHDPRTVAGTAFERAYLMGAIERIYAAFPHAVAKLPVQDHDAVVVYYGLHRFGLKVIDEANRFRQIDSKTIVLSIRKLHRRLASILREAHRPDGKPDPVQQAALDIVEQGLLADAITVGEVLHSC